jgi:hypothetical protein
MLKELVKRWDNHKIMVRWLSRFFNYLDRYFIARRSLPALSEVGLMCFRDLVCCLYSLVMGGRWNVWSLCHACRLLLFVVVWWYFGL